MIKTIDTDVITDEMLYAGVYAAERCSDAGITDLKDVVYEAIFSALEVASAVDQAQSGWLRAIDEALVMHDVGVANADDDYATAKDKLNKLLCVLQDIGAYFAKQESAQSAAEPVYFEANDYGPGWLITDERTYNRRIELNRMKLYHQPTVPPAIDDELREKVLELCELTLINGGPAGMVTAAMMQRAKAIREMMGEA